LSKNEIVAAADSRGKSGPGQYQDHQCKIIALSDKLVFASNGMADFEAVSSSHPPERIVLDVNKEAKRAFKSAISNSSGDFSGAALLWARDVQRIFEHAIRVSGVRGVLEDLPDGSITQGYFFGVSPKGDLAFYYESINRSGNSVLVDPPKSLPLYDVLVYGGNGVTDTVKELREGKTTWARNEAARWERQSGTFPSDQRAVLKAVRWVELTLAAHPDSDEVGGAVDSLSVTPFGIHWHNRKPECHDQVQQQKLPATKASRPLHP
jgi:hypothetical protein